MKKKKIKKIIYYCSVEKRACIDYCHRVSLFYKSKSFAIAHGIGYYGAGNYKIISYGFKE